MTTTTIFFTASEPPVASPTSASSSSSSKHGEELKKLVHDRVCRRRQLQLGTLRVMVSPHVDVSQQDPAKDPQQNHHHRFLSVVGVGKVVEKDSAHPFAVPPPTSPTHQGKTPTNTPRPIVLITPQQPTRPRAQVPVRQHRHRPSLLVHGVAFAPTGMFFLLFILFLFFLYFVLYLVASRQLAF